MSGTGTEANDSDLERAAERGDLGTLKDLIQARSTDFHPHTDLFTSLAQISCRRGHVSVLQYLINDLSVDIDSATTTRANNSLRMPLGSSLLQISIFHDESKYYDTGRGITGNTFACIEWLTRRGANIHQENSEGEDALATALRTKHLQALGCLSWSLINQFSDTSRHSSLHHTYSSDFDVYQVTRPYRDFLDLLGLVWHVECENSDVEDRNHSRLADIFKTLEGNIFQSVFEENSTSDYRWIGEPACIFSHEDSVSSCILKIPLFTYIPQGKLKSRWEDACDARKRLGIRGIKTNAGLEVISTFDEYCYPDLGQEALKERNGDQVVCKYIQRLTGKLSDDSPMLAISQACVWRFQKEDGKDSIFFSVMETSPPSRDIHNLFTWGVPVGLVAGRTADEFIGAVLSWMLVGFDILLRDSDTFHVPRLVTIFARSIARVQQDVNEYIQQSDIKIAKEKGFLHDIEDIREEISMVQTVLIQQEVTWREFAQKSWPKFWRNGYEGHFESTWRCDGKYQEQKKADRPRVESQADDSVDVGTIMMWRYIQMPQEHFRKLRTQLDKLDRDAERVQRSIELKLDLKQRHASLKEARTASLMGASVAGFTIVTIVFTPLSFMTGLFALPIDRLEVAQSAAPDYSPGVSGSYSTAYIAKWMATTELVALAVTIFCVWLALKYFTQGDDEQNQLRGLFDKSERAGGKDKAQSVKDPESATGSGNNSNRQREDITQDAVGETEHLGSKQSVREWAISMLERLLNFLKNGRERTTPV